MPPPGRHSQLRTPVKHNIGFPFPLLELDTETNESNLDLIMVAHANAKAKAVSSASSRLPLTHIGRCTTFPLGESASAPRIGLGKTFLDQSSDPSNDHGQSLGARRQSMTSLINKGRRKSSLTKLEDVRSALMGTRHSLANLQNAEYQSKKAQTKGSFSMRPSISSQALKGLSKIIPDTNTRTPTEDYPQDPDFFRLIQANPADPVQRQAFQDTERDLRKYIRKHPEALKAMYDFPVGGRGNLTVSRYPLSTLVALGASLSLIKLAVRANPTALEPSKDFGTTVLHTACSFHTDMEVLEYIYSKNPKAVEETTKLVFLPLHNACAKANPSLEIIQFLVDVHPQGLLAINKLGDTPLRIAQRNKTASKEILNYLEEETERVSSLDENQQRWKDVTERQSWGSQNSAEAKQATALFASFTLPMQTEMPTGTILAATS